MAGQREKVRECFFCVFIPPSLPRNAPTCLPHFLPLYRRRNRQHNFHQPGQVSREPFLPPSLRPALLLLLPSLFLLLLVARRSIAWGGGREGGREGGIEKGRGRLEGGRERGLQFSKAVGRGREGGGREGRTYLSRAWSANFHRGAAALLSSQAGAPRVFLLLLEG